MLTYTMARAASGRSSICNPAERMLGLEDSMMDFGEFNA